MSAQGKKGKQGGGGGAGGRTPSTPTTPKQTQQQQPQPAAAAAAAQPAVVTAAATPSVASAVPAASGAVAASPVSAAGGGAAAAAAAVAPASASASVSSFVPMLPPASQLLPGASVRVRTSLQSDPFDGVLFVYDAAANLLVVERAYDFADERNYNTRAEASDPNQPGEGKKDFAILNAKCVRVELVAPAPAKPRALPPLSMEAINSKAVAGQQERMEEMSSIGVGVSPEGQKLFDAVRKTTPCVWRDQSFLVMDCVRVPPPYTVAACHIVPQQQQQQQQQQQGQGRRGNSHAQSAAQAAAAEVMLARVRKIVDAERIKLKLTNTQ